MYRHILAATDFSDLGDRALVRASNLAVALGAKLSFVHVMVSEDSPSPMYAQHEVRAQVAALQERLGERAREHVPNVDVDFEVRVGDPAAEILAAAEARGADLVVVSRHGERGFAEWLLGSTTDKLVRRAVADVLVVT